LRVGISFYFLYTMTENTTLSREALKILFANEEKLKDLQEKYVKKTGLSLKTLSPAKVDNITWLEEFLGSTPKVKEELEGDKDIEILHL